MKGTLNEGNLSARMQSYHPAVAMLVQLRGASYRSHSMLPHAVALLGGVSRDAVSAWGEDVAWWLCIAMFFLFCNRSIAVLACAVTILRIAARVCSVFCQAPREEALPSDWCMS